MIEHIPELINANITSLKIEGRMKSVYYVGAIVRLYRAALDYMAEQIAQSGPGALNDLTIPNHFTEELPKIGSRASGYSRRARRDPTVEIA